jgi:hypothetical protein
MNALLKTFPPELNLRDDETFRSKTNVDICQMLIPKLQKEMKMYNITYDQLDTWLQSIHRSKRNAYLRANQLNPDECNAESDSTIRSVQQQTTPRVKKFNNFCDEEIDEGAKVCDIN